MMEGPESWICNVIGLVSFSTTSIFLANGTAMRIGVETLGAGPKDQKCPGPRILTSLK